MLNTAAHLNTGCAATVGPVSDYLPSTFTIYLGSPVTLSHSWPIRCAGAPWKTAAEPSATLSISPSP